MDYQADEEVVRLIARSDALTAQSRVVNERGMRTSTVLRRVLAQCDYVCAMSDRLYGGRSGVAWALEEAEPESSHVF